MNTLNIQDDFDDIAANMQDDFAAVDPKNILLDEHGDDESIAFADSILNPQSDSDSSSTWFDDMREDIERKYESDMLQNAREAAFYSRYEKAQ